MQAIHLASHALIKLLFSQVQPSILILKNNASLYKKLKGVLLAITRFRQPLDKISGL
jgi:hypothetical protein